MFLKSVRGHRGHHKGIPQSWNAERVENLNFTNIAAHVRKVQKWNDELSELWLLKIVYLFIARTGLGSVFSLEAQ
jgi:hypothetical protein